MISRKYKAGELVGKICYPIHPIKNGGGYGITSATKCHIVSAYYGVEIKTEPCKCCGQYCTISRISRDELVLDEDVKYVVYLWENIEDKSSLGLFPWTKLDMKDAVIVGRFDGEREMRACVGTYENATSVCGVWKIDKYSGISCWFD